MKSRFKTPLALPLVIALAGSAMAADSNDAQLAAGPGMASNHAHKTFTSAQAQEMRVRVQLAETIARHVEADALTKGASESWRIGLLSSLYNTPSENLRDIAASARTLDAAQMQAAAAVIHANANVSPVTTRSGAAPENTAAAAPKSLGSVTDSLVFTPITPCRFIDTRVVGGPIGSPRDFDTSLAGSFYGGVGGCTMPGVGEPGLALNVTVVVDTGNAGYLGIRPFGNAATTSFLNWPAGGTQGLANAGVITTALNGSGHYAFEVFAGANTPQVIVDYFGYFSAAAPVALECVGPNSHFSALNPGSITVVNSTCPAGYVGVAAYCDTLPEFGLSLNGSGLVSSDTAFCRWTNSTAGILNGYVGITCCRVP
jgi:hypothetical protein